MTRGASDTESGGSVLSPVGDEGHLNASDQTEDTTRFGIQDHILEIESEEGTMGGKIINLVYCNSPGKSQCALKLNNFIISCLKT